MNEQRQQAYLNLIQQLLNCPQDEEENILQANAELVDEELVQVMEQVAAMMEQQGEGNPAWLRSVAAGLSQYLQQSQSPTSMEDHVAFIETVLQAEAESNGDIQVVYPLLQQHQAKLDKNFAKILQQWARDAFSEGDSEEEVALAAVIGNLCVHITDFTPENRASNLEIAITGYETVLEVYTRQAFPQEWAMTQNNLGNAYCNRIWGEKGENLEKAITYHEAALQVFTRRAFPQDWAGTQNNLGNAYRERIRGEKGENLETAITYYEAALQVYTRQAFPQQWALTQNNLGNAYLERIRGEKAENLEKAIAAFESALQVRTRQAFPQQWAMTQTNLGNAYCDHIRGEKGENLEKAIAACQAALQVYTCEAFPQDWAKTQNTLGNAYCDRIRGEKRENLEKAIAYYEAALQVYTLQAFPQAWATTQNNLGAAYRDRIRGEKGENLEKAIAYYEAALQVRTRQAFPQDWAGTQTNLGNAYCDRIRGEKGENLEKAIAYYEATLQVFTRRAFPQDWAKTQNNLGTVYYDRIRGEKGENLEKAIAYYEAALQVFTRRAFPQEWALTQNNLGNAYLERIQGEEGENLEKAIAYYEAILQVRTRQAFPQDWAGTQTNLGNAYCNRIQGEKGENLEKAIAYYEAALQVFTRQTFPQQWARTQNNLGVAYRDRIRGKKGENLEKAIACYQDALDVYTRKAFPLDYAQPLFNLGLTYQTITRLPEAYRSFAEAIDTVEFLRGEIRFGSANEEDKRKLAEKYNQIYQRMVEVCLQLKEDCQAVEYVERSKTRNLVESLTNRALYPEGEIPLEIRQQLRQLQQEIEEEKRRLSTETNPDYSHLNDLRQQYNQLYPEIPLSFAQIPSLLDGGTAIIEWYLLDGCFQNCFCAFLITRDSTQPQVWTSTAEDLEEFRKWVNDYLAGYREFKQAYEDYQQAYQKVQTETEKQQIRQKIESLQQQWEKSLITRLEKLAAILHINELISLLSPHIDQLVLIPHRYLHLLPLHALPIKSNTEGADSFTPLLDKFPRGVRYIPSCQLLQKVQERQRPDFSRLLGIQTPTKDLYKSSIGYQAEVYQADWGVVTAIKKQFTHPQTEIIRKEKATKSAILDSPDKLQATNCLIFFCHGYFNFKSPLDSGLQLADGELTLEEIIGKFNLKNCRLVTLSACETGAIDIGNNSDEYIGLPFGFLLAGSTNVVVSLWSVDSTATALLMAKFYQELQQPQANITVALKTAQNWLRQTTVAGFRDWLSHSQFSIASQEQLKIKHLKKIEEEKGATYQPFSNPYYWAAFCAIGKGV